MHRRPNPRRSRSCPRLAAATLVTAVLTAVLLGVPAIVVGQTASWVWPTHNASQAQEKQLTVVDHYAYQVREYSPPLVIERGVPAGEQRFATPEEAMISRVSAMMALDYERWLATWDEESRQLSLARSERNGKSADEFLSWWRGTFTTARIHLLRRVDAGPFVVITYSLFDAAGREVGGGLEFPVVFRQVDGRWAATLRLRRDPLVPASPWLTGERQVEQVVR